MFDQVWHYNDNQGVFCAPRIHANGHIRPKAVSFSTRATAAIAWCDDVEERINVCTRLMHSARKNNIKAQAALKRNVLRAIERRAKALLKELTNTKDPS
jgi:hypothetical protein